jgi:hypothetical protein
MVRPIRFADRWRSNKNFREADHVPDSLFLVLNHQLTVFANNILQPFVAESIERIDLVTEVPHIFCPALQHVLQLLASE